MVPFFFLKQNTEVLFCQKKQKNIYGFAKCYAHMRGALRKYTPNNKNRKKTIAVGTQHTEIE